MLFGSESCRVVRDNPKANGNTLTSCKQKEIVWEPRGTRYRADEDAALHQIEVVPRPCSPSVSAEGQFFILEELS